ncbi:UDP-glycosyltransferase 71K1-like [Gossypium arboreum]|uniref:UDP-glycosyltransferase 71K1-like n=1 Tax=Gossypium arboreum TaxID=29729 RepID=UPI0022F1D7D8|nr:UDP-glycosyltransferase 71K1-like [Gossypium arboreum]
MKKAKLIFVPSTGKGHLIPVLKFAKRLVDHDDQIFISVVFVKLSSDPFVDAYIESIKASKLDRIDFIDVSQQQQQHCHSIVGNHSRSVQDHVNVVRETHTPLLKDFVVDLLSRSRLDSATFVGFIFDLFFVSLVDVAHEFNVPSYIFLTGNAGFLSLLFHLMTRHGEICGSPEFKQSDPDQLISGFINPVPLNVLPSALFDKDNGYPLFMTTAQKFKAVKGIVVNTFEELEPYAISSFSDHGNPPVYPIGPPQSSVIFLCFGSFGRFLAPQVKEIALGLEQSGYKFLWSSRVPPRNDDPGGVHYSEDMLPEGFVERIQGKGMMIYGWAPQVEILAHEAIGGFISHCGWNSILESLWFGVPMIMWPMYAEQKLNAFKMVKELGLAVELRLEYEQLNVDDVVMADEIEKAIKQVMDERNEVRKKVREMAKIARKSIVSEGSSFLSIQKLINDMICNN